jgi:NAD(P)-dependent dehydrogenase (short-subunit alcohol dehydrogenase family)
MSRIAIVTGGSRGIGAATCELLGAAGYAVVVNYARDAKAAEAVAAKVEALGGKAIAVQGDVGHEADILKLFKACDDAFGPLTALVNNAGMLNPQWRVADMTAEGVSRVLGVNVLGSILCAREAVNRMSTTKGGKGGAVVNLSSVAARLGAANEYVDYAASKGAIDSFTLGLAREVAAEGIRVNAVRPGLIDTEIHASGGDAERPNRLRTMVPMQRIGSAKEVAEAIVWLLSDAASYVSGTNLEVTGAR